MNSQLNLEPPPQQASWNKRLFAYMMSRSDRQYDELVAGRKTALLGGLHGTVLEIGAGAAPNLIYYPRDIHWLGIEPNPAMFQYAQRQAQQLGITAEMRYGQAEALQVTDNSVDAVVSTLVMCSVRDQEKTLSEIRRVLKPGGRFVFIEHVAAPDGSRLRRLQGFIRPAWGFLGDGCRPDRETWTAIQNAGFAHVELEHFHVPTPVIGPHIAGFAVK